MSGEMVAEMIMAGSRYKDSAARKLTLVARDLLMESCVQFIDPHSVTFCEASGDCYGAVQLSGPTRWVSALFK